MHYLIRCDGLFIGDILFASSIAKKLHEQDAHAVVDYFIPLVQPGFLLKMNPFITDIYIDPSQLQGKTFDKVIQLPPVMQSIPATIQFQIAAGVTNPTPEFDVYTVPTYDFFAKSMLDKIRLPNQLLIAYDIAWRAKAYNTTEEMINRGVGGPHRDIELLISRLRSHYTMIPVGLPEGTSQQDPKARDPATYAMTASFIKNCDFMLGPEGGLTNLASSVGTKCIITTDYIYQLYGPKGLFRPFPDPKMGPATYYPTGGHTHLPPWITDDEVYSGILRALASSQS